MSLSQLEEALVNALQHIADSTAASWVQDFANDAIALAEKTAVSRAESIPAHRREAPPMTQPKALNAEGKCVCELSSLPANQVGLCGKPYYNSREDDGEPPDDSYCENSALGYRDAECGHPRACHPSPLNADKERSE